MYTLCSIESVYSQGCSLSWINNSFKKFCSKPRVITNRQNKF